MQDTINRANRTADLIRKLAELSGFCITGMVQLTDSKTGLELQYVLQKSDFDKGRKTNENKGRC